jgi:hypothetical protein
MLKTLNTLFATAALMVSASALALPTNLLPNADFANGLTGWTEANTPNSSGCCNGPAYVAAPGSVNMDFDGSGPFNLSFRHDITLTGNYADADLSFDYLADGAYFGQDRTLNVNILDTNGVSLLNLFSTAVPLSEFQISHNAHVFGSSLAASLNNLGAGTFTFAFDRFIPEFYTGPGILNLSNISFTGLEGASVPEPSSLLLLGLGLMGLVVQRKKTQA